MKSGNKFPFFRKKAIQPAGQHPDASNQKIDLHGKHFSRTANQAADLSVGREWFSALRFLLSIIGAVFLAEVFAMTVLLSFRTLPYYVQTLIDAGIMVVLISPVIYLLSFRPLLLHIEKRRQAEQQVQEMALFPTLNPDAVLQVDASGQIVKTNPAANKMGLMIGAQLSDLIPDLRDMDLPIWIAERKTQQIPQTQLSERVLQWVIHGAPELGLAFLYSTDVTEQKRAEAEIYRLSSIVQQTTDTVVVTNREGVIEYVNPAFERQTGYGKDEVLGQTPRVLKSGLHDEMFYRELWETILSGKSYQNEMTNRRKSGMLFHEVKTITPLRDATGNITHFVATGKDITERKEAEEKLRVANDELELRVQERTEELEAEITERKQVEAALRESEQWLNRAQEIAHLGSWELDLVNNRLSWSDEVYRLFGLQPQKFGASYEAFLEAVHPADRVAVDDAYSSSVSDGKDGYEIEHRIIRRLSGEVRIVHEKCEHFKNAAGQIIHSVGMVHDITERKQAEEALRRSEALLNQTGKMAKVGGWELDLLTMTPRWSLEACRIHEVDPSFKPQLETAIDFYAPEVRSQITEAVRRVIYEGESYDLELPLITAKGNQIWIRTMGQPELQDGKSVGLLGSIQDITERKLAEAALRRAHDELELRVQERTAELAVANRELRNEIAERREIERQLRIQTTAMEAAANGILITDAQGNILWTNPALTQMSGYGADELVGQNTRIFNSGKHEPDYYRSMWTTILAGEVWKGETTNRRKDGGLYIEGQTITPVRSEEGKISHFIAIKEDITDKKQAEQDIRARNEKEKMLTQMIHTMQLDIARDLHDTLGQNISFLRMKLDYLTGKKIRKQADLQMEIQNMARAASESYDLMRGTLAILQSTDSTDLYRLFTRYTEQIEERSGFKVDFCSQGEPKPISAPRMRQLFYIFREILNNVEKHAHASQVTIEMIWVADHLKLIVFDNGQGFDASEVQFGGHYGLRFMRERANLLNGSLALRSEPGSGTNVAVLIPYETS